uniref:Cytochrome c-553 n=1 Tax=Chromera velia CCMP2878 TaxID=1169474 RepID=A0A0G4GQG2_9ALVE|mmetsp:Transcript_31088/g.61293  ORF Transcript_31088/g.61293 Transcript_31088/m.61293 type:complete len:166 (+) Transcript_31088:133-630(+)|eukprot:Cvel_22922.t1-p1 / transcript=Cvel_22922.t1 / gene=Cvel_22922 / organism=Chromera_velia_CCMP2878 / gene_product=Cytochrome c6, putative / transcript_product=Cytochrome c6, putative / location=Cvel_scaffold2305:9805-10299(+) / protein_length=165 / sequence_SO=supercontig / SO=protein_coding / is_pseudo=false
MKAAVLCTLLGVSQATAFLLNAGARRMAECKRVVMSAAPDASEEDALEACDLGRAAVLALPLIASAFAPLGGVAPAFAEGDAELGELVFSGNCAACHAGGNNVVKAEKTLKKAALDENGMNSFDKVVYQVTNGKNAMPAFGGRLSEDDIQNVASYVLDQANGNKW